MALRYGRFYFRPLSGNHQDFGISPFPGGVLSFSRILADDEVLTVANTDPNQGHDLDVIVDSTLNTVGTKYQILFSNKKDPIPPSPVTQTGPVTVNEVDGTIGHGPLHVVHVTLKPMEVQILAR